MKKRLLVIVFVLVSIGLSATDLVPESETPYGFDQLVNRSRLTNKQLRYYFEHCEESKAAELLDLDKDGIADFTDIKLWEFIARMAIILEDQSPFTYKKDVYGNDLKVEEERDYWVPVDDI